MAARLAAVALYTGYAEVAKGGAPVCWINGEGAAPSRGMEGGDEWSI
jgi:hypothetical protein